MSLSILLTGCGDDGVNLFSIKDDLSLGAQLKSQIEQDTSFAILDRTAFPSAYVFLESMLTDILASDNIRYKDDFPWEITILHDDETLNAFAAPGGYLYVYTGLIKFLESKDDLAGVLGHEVAHADRRHSTQQLTQRYGISLLLGVIGGQDPSTLSQVLGSLVGLQFSRSDEEEADRFSVHYLCDTEYAANGAASFFEKITAKGGPRPPEFLSTHPNPDNRVAAINGLAKEQACDTVFDSSASEWLEFQQSLP